MEPCAQTEATAVKRLETSKAPRSNHWNLVFPTIERCCQKHVLTSQKQHPFDWSDWSRLPEKKLTKSPEFQTQLLHNQYLSFLFGHVSHNARWIQSGGRTTVGPSEHHWYTSTWSHCHPTRYTPNYLSHANTKQHNLFTATLCTSTS